MKRVLGGGGEEKTARVVVAIVLVHGRFARLLGWSSMIVLVPGALVVESSRFSNVATKTKQKSGRNKAESRMSWPGRLSSSLSVSPRGTNCAPCIDGDAEWGKDCNRIEERDVG